LNLRASKPGIEQFVDLVAELALQVFDVVVGALVPNRLTSTSHARTRWLYSACERVVDIASSQFSQRSIER
jgi:hypothetical protein